MPTSFLQRREISAGIKESKKIYYIWWAHYQDISCHLLVIKGNLASTSNGDGTPLFTPLPQSYNLSTCRHHVSTKTLTLPFASYTVLYLSPQRCPICRPVQNANKLSFFSLLPFRLFPVRLSFLLVAFLSYASNAAFVLFAFPSFHTLSFLPVAFSSYASNAVLTSCCLFILRQ
jgi:hypothetical protein